MTTSLQRGILYRFRTFMVRFYHVSMEQAKLGVEIDDIPISKAEATFLTSALDRYDGKFARFWMTAKIHKTPFKMRPIVTCCGTFLNDWSRWLNYQLQ